MYKMIGTGVRGADINLKSLINYSEKERNLKEWEYCELWHMC